MPSDRLSPKQIASRIDHTLLKPEADAAAVDARCAEALAYGFAAVCVNGGHVSRVARALAGSSVLTCAVAGFPLGAMASGAKAEEAARACADGAQEIDFVASLPMLMHEEADALRREWSAIVEAARGVTDGVVTKVIIESAALMAGVPDDVAERRIALACDTARATGVDFVKTSTGFHPAGGATVAAVALMRKHGDGLRVKASGGIRTYDDATTMISAGADRLGCSASVTIVAG